MNTKADKIAVAMALVVIAFLVYVALTTNRHDWMACI